MAAKPDGGLTSEPRLTTFITVRVFENQPVFRANAGVANSVAHFCITCSHLTLAIG